MSRARLLFVLLVFLASFMRAAVANDRDDAELELMLAERRGLDVGAPLRWHYAIEDVPARELASLHAALARIGCSEITVPEMDAENDAGRHEVWADERRARDVRSYAERLAEVRAIARAHRAHLAFWGVYALERE